MTPFLLQLGHPKINSLEQKEFESLSEVFRFLFRENEESAYLFWHDIPIRWHYTYEMYVNFNEWVSILWLLFSKEEGANKCLFTTDTLFMEWEVRWNADDLQIESTFTSKRNAYHDYAAALNEHPVIECSKKAFLAEWNTLILQLNKSLDAADVTITDEKENLKYIVLQKLAANLHAYGKLYVNH